MPDVPIELEIGDVAIFHCNTLHSSADNHSAESRIGLLGCYNTKHNDPYKAAHGHPGWQVQPKIAEPIIEADRQNSAGFQLPVEAGRLRSEGAACVSEQTFPGEAPGCGMPEANVRAPPQRLPVDPTGR